jgi:hypothetical protein
MTQRFLTLQDWLHFCELDGSGPADAEEIQQAVRTLITALERHEDGQQLANLWFARHGGGRWRLVSVIGKRTRKEDVS